MLAQEKMLRKNTRTALGVPAFLHTPEDLVLAKLRMIRATVRKERALKVVGDVKAFLRFSKVDVVKLQKNARMEGTLKTFEDVTVED